MKQTRHQRHKRGDSCPEVIPPKVFARIAGGLSAQKTGATGLEPATSGVTGRRSNKLNYAPEPEHCTTNESLLPDWEQTFVCR